MQYGKEADDDEAEYTKAHLREIRNGSNGLLMSALQEMRHSEKSTASHYTVQER